MTISRRDVLAQGAALALTAGLTPARAQTQIGPYQLDVVSDGALTLPGGFIFEPMPQDQLMPLLAELGQSAEVLTPPCNVTLLRGGGRTVLFDVGSGADFAPNSGQLLTSLEAINVAPEDVTDVVFTHAHPDHLWGLLDDFDDLMFPEASYMIGQSEWDYWTNPATVDEIAPSRTAFAVGAQRRLAMIEDAVSLIQPGDEILPGVMAHASFGHTPGHLSFEVNGGGESAMIIGDSIGNPHVAFARPDWPSGSDQDRDTAAATRLRQLDQLSQDKMQIVGYHLTGNGLGYVERHKGGYVFLPKEA